MLYFLFVDLCWHKDRAKAIEPILLKLSQNLIFKPKQVLENFQKSTTVLAKNLKSFSKIVVFIFLKTYVGFI